MTLSDSQAETSDAPLVAVSSVSRHFPGPVPVIALDEVTLQLAAGTVTAVMGPSGSGKSTLLNLLGLLDTPTSGTYALAGVPVPFDHPRRLARLRREYLGFVFQGYHLLHTKNVIDNVAFGAAYLNMSRRERYRSAYGLLCDFGLAERAAAMPATLSGGERQRTAIARALIGGRRVLLCDEPTGNLDEENTEVVVQQITRVAERGVAVVIVTHGSAVARCAQTVYRLRDGRIDHGGGPR